MKKFNPEKFAKELYAEGYRLTPFAMDLIQQARAEYKAMHGIDPFDKKAMSKKSKRPKK